MKSRHIVIAPVSSRAKTIFKNQMNSDGKCKIEMEGGTMYFVNSVHKNKNLVVFKTNDKNWHIVPEEKVS